MRLLVRPWFSDSLTRTVLCRPNCYILIIFIIDALNMLLCLMNYNIVMIAKCIYSLLNFGRHLNERG